jgi:hypothetical protein
MYIIQCPNKMSSVRKRQGTCTIVAEPNTIRTSNVVRFFANITGAVHMVDLLTDQEFHQGMNEKIIR